jgi:AcrR family transcriptional regulator
MIYVSKKEEKQNKILDAAYEVFVGKGYSDTTMDDIVKKSNMSKGAIYHYYSSKKTLFLALIDHWETYSFPDFYTKNKKNKLASEILMDIAGVVYDVFKKRKHVFLAEVEFWSLANKDNDVKEKSRALYNKLLYLFELILKKGIRDKEFRDIDTKIVSMNVLTSLQGINWFCLFDDSQIDAELYLKTSMELLIKSLKRNDNE